MIDYSIPEEFITENSFLVQAHDEGELTGEAKFWRERELNIGVWKARVDVKDKPKYRKKGIATNLLITGDDYVEHHFPNDIREFENLNAEAGFSYSEYTDSIGNEQIISFEGNQLRFKPK